MTDQTTEQTTTEAQAETKPLTGRAKVRTYLIQPLEELGFTRPGNVSAVEWKELLAKLADRLAYLTPRHLEALVEIVIRIHGAKAKWPKIATIIHHAWALQPPPPQESTYAMSLIKSAAGRRARDEGYHVELYRIAKKLGPPPGKYVHSKLRDEAEDNRRQVARISERIERGVADQDDRSWLSAYLADRDECLAILDADDDGEVAA